MCIRDRYVHAQGSSHICPGRAGVPMEVMGLMLGQFIDDYTINCVDVTVPPFARDGHVLCRLRCLRCHSRGRA